MRSSASPGSSVPAAPTSGWPCSGSPPPSGARSSSTARRSQIRSPHDAMRLGIAYLSEDRRRLGLSMPQSVASNITLPAIGSYRTPFGLLDRSAEECGRRTLPRSAEHSHGLAAHAGRQPVRWQPAEDDARQVAQRGAADPDPRRADPRASTSAPRPMSTSSSTTSLATASPSSSSPPISPRCWR